MASTSRRCITARRRTSRTQSVADARSSPATTIGGYIHVPRMVEGAKVRDRGADDEYAQATLFWNSMTEIEQDHIVDAYTFELGHVEVPAVVERMVTRLALVDLDLARRVCVGLGLPAPVPPAMAPADASIDDDTTRENAADARCVGRSRDRHPRCR